MEGKLALLITVRIIHTLSNALLISFFGGWYRQRCLMACTFIKLQHVLALHRNKRYKVRPEDFLFISIHLAPKMLCAICSYPRSKYPLPDTSVQCMTQPYSTAAAFSQHRQSSSSCSLGQTPWLSQALHLIYPRVQLQAEEETTDLLFTAKYSNV